jgi:hypothetical protein
MIKMNKEIGASWKWYANFSNCENMMKFNLT